MKKSFPTLTLLFSSVMISFSGSARIIIAYLFLGLELKVLNVIAVFLIIYSTYTFDRAAGGEEDAINRKELSSARRDVGIAVSILSFFAGTIILCYDNMLSLAFIPYTLGYIYSKGLRLRDFSLRLKGGLGSKNLVVAFTWGTFITGVAVKGIADPIVTISLYSFFFVKTFINTVMNDFKDVEGDMAAGLRTLPVYLGEIKTRILLMCIHLLEHGLIALLMLFNVLQPEYIILVSCSLGGIIYIALFAKPVVLKPFSIKKAIFHITYRWEFYVALGLRAGYVALI